MDKNKLPQIPYSYLKKMLNYCELVQIRWFRYKDGREGIKPTKDNEGFGPWLEGYINPKDWHFYLVGIRFVPEKYGAEKLNIREQMIGIGILENSFPEIDWEKLIKNHKPKMGY